MFKCGYLLGLLALSSFVLAQSNYDDPSNYWINPPPSSGVTGVYSKDPTYSVGSVISLQWKSNWTSLLVRINQDVARGNTYSDIASNYANTGSLQWTVQVPTGMNLTELPVFWFTIWDQGGSGRYVLSHYFNITATSSSASVSTQTTVVSQTVTVSSSALASTATSATSTGGSVTSASSTGGAASTTQHSNDTAGGLSSGAKIGIGVGVSLGTLCVILAVVAGVLLARQRRYTRKSAASTEPKDYDSVATGFLSQDKHQHSVQQTAVPVYHELQQPGQNHYEMNAQRQYRGYELPGESLK